MKLIKKPSLIFERLAVYEPRFKLFGLSFGKKLVGYNVGASVWSSIEVEGSLLVGQTFNHIRIDDFEFDNLKVDRAHPTIQHCYICKFDNCRQFKQT